MFATPAAGGSVRAASSLSLVDEARAWWKHVGMPWERSLDLLCLKDAQRTAVVRRKGFLTAAEVRVLFLLITHATVHEGGSPR
jgi:hypothetical protein